MGVEHTHYVIRGVRFAFDDFSDELFEENFSPLEDNGYQKDITANPDGITVVADGMNGEYLVIGKVITKSLEHEGMEFTEIGSGTIKETQKIAQAIEKVIQTKVKPKSIKVFAFTHFY